MHKGKRTRRKTVAIHTSSGRDMRQYPSVNVYAIALVAILAFSVFMEVYFFYGPSQINAADNFLYTNIARNVVDHGTVTLSYGADVFKSEYVLIFGISIFYALMGRSVMAFAMFGIVTFIGTVLIIYLIGSELYNRKAALLASFLYSFYPMAVIYGSNVSDTGPMAFFAALSVLLMILAYKRGGSAKRKKAHGNEVVPTVALYVLSGAIAVLGLLITAEGIIILVPIFIFLMANAAYTRDRASLSGLGLESLGVLVGLAVILLLSAAITGNPLHAISTLSTLYTSIPNVHANLISYIYTMMPYSVSSPAVPFNYNPDNYLSGYFLYASIVAVIYLVFKKDKKSVLPGIWFIASLLYLSYGTMSLSRYNIIQFATRYAIIFGPAMVLLAARTFETFIGAIKQRKRAFDYMYVVRVSVSAAIIILMLAQSLYLIWYISSSEYESVYPLAQIGDYLNSLPPGSQIMQPFTVYLDAYVNKGYKISTFGIINASEVPSGAYAIAGSRADFPQGCGMGNVSGLTEVFSPVAGNITRFSIMPEHCNMYDLKVYTKGAT